MNKKILYLCTAYPFPADSGGKQCWIKHINELLNSKYNSDIKYVFFSSSTNIQKNNLNIDYKVTFAGFDSKPSIKNKIKRFLALLTIYPLDMSLKYFTTIHDKDTRWLNTNLIILDQIGMLPIMSTLKKNKFIYIAHNIEKDYYLDLAKLESHKILKILKYIDALKITFLENSVLKNADKIVCISTSDYKIISKKYKNKTVLLPHKIDLQEEKWTGSANKTLFFCGAPWFYPNKEAIEWIANELSPILSKDIKIKIAGKGTDELPQNLQRDNIEYLGFVSKEELYELYKTSSAFICPIVYGSGVKIKVTEALSFGCPVIATKESLEGLDYIDIKPLIDRTDLETTKKNIEDLISNQERLQNFSNDLINQIETYQKENDVSLEKIIDEVI